MNTRASVLRVTLAPAALAAAMAMAMGLSAPAQAQYTYPGSDSSGGHSAKTSPMRAGARQRAEYGNASTHPGRGNPSMQHGEACPPGSRCATPVPAHGSGGSGSGHPAGGYGARESYGYAASPTQRNTTAGGKA